MMFHLKHILIKYELQKHRLVHQSDILLCVATKPCYIYETQKAETVLSAVIYIYIYRSWSIVSIIHMSPRSRI